MMFGHRLGSFVHWAIDPLLGQELIIEGAAWRKAARGGGSHNQGSPLRSLGPSSCRHLLGGDTHPGYWVFPSSHLKEV